MREETNKRVFKFSISDEIGDITSIKYDVTKVDDSENEIEFILEWFKRFLVACGYSELTIDRIQYLEDEEFKYVLKEYGLWTSEHEKYFR